MSETKIMKKNFLLAFLFLAHLSAFSVNRYVVSGNNTSSNLGLTWATANGNLQTMINAASSGDSVFVAAGVYSPQAYPNGCTTCSSSRDYSFSMKTGVKVFGGFNPNDSWADRDPKLKLTVLEGNIGSFALSSDNVHHVVVAVDADFFKLDGFRIRNGNGNVSTSVNIIRNFVSYSVSRNKGAGVYVENTQYGGVRNCEFDNNAAHTGGAINIIDCPINDLTIESTVFRNNSATSFGGAIALFDSRVVAKSILFYENSAGTEGKAIDAFFNSRITVSFGTFYSNNLSSNNTLINIASNSDLRLNSSIVWNNYFSSLTPFLNSSTSSSITMNNNILSGGYSACTGCPGGNGNVDPEFLNTSDVNGTDNIFGTMDDGLMLSSCSPGIDHPLNNVSIIQPTLDITLRGRANDYNLDNTETYDLGAYEKYLPLSNEKIYVNVDLTTGLNNGTKATNAFRGATALQNALDEAASTCEPVDILIAEGVYQPSSYPAGCTDCSTSQDYTFLLPPNTNLIGGYNSSFSSNDADTYPVYLDGNLGSPLSSSDNAHHILLTIDRVGRENKIKNIYFRRGGSTDYVSGTSTSTEITVGSVTIPRNNGGAIYHYNAGTALDNCRFINNRVDAGVLYLRNNSEFYGNNYDDLIFRDNVTIPKQVNAVYTIASIVDAYQANFVLNRAKFYDNTSTQGFASIGFYIRLSTVDIHRSTFYENEGDLFNTNSTIFSMTNSIVYNQQNRVFNITGSISGNTNISHCDFVHSTSGQSPISLSGGNLAVANSVLWNTSSSSPTITVSPTYTGAAPIVNNSILKNGWTGCINCPGGNGDIDPQFKNINSLFGDFDEKDSFDDGLQPQVTSPMLNAGTIISGITNDVVGISRSGPQPEIGAYESRFPRFCDYNWYLTDKTLPTYNYRAAERIISESVVPASSNVIMGGENVLLLPGFETTPGAVFLADPNEKCSFL